MMMDIYPDTMPLVSVVMATYNRAGYLERSITSFLQQTYRHAELIVVDDGSSDDTFQVVNQLMKSHPSIRYMKHTNRKLSLSRNAGILAAGGQFIAFLDSDDEYRTDYLEKRIEFMNAHPTVDLIEGGVIVIGDPFVKDKNDLSKKIHISDCIVGATFFGRKEVFLSVGGFDKTITYSEDSLFWEKAEAKFNLQKINHEGYIYYRDTPDSICNTV